MATQLTDANAVAKMLRWGDGQATKYAAQLQAYIAAATIIIENMVGPVVPATVVRTLDGAASLSVPYARTVTSVVVDGFPVTGWTFDQASSLIYGPFGRGRQNVTVTYTVGAETVPANVAFAATSLVVHMWGIASQRTPGLPEDFTTVPTGFLVPNVVKEALAPQRTVPGFA